MWLLTFQEKSEMLKSLIFIVFTAAGLFNTAASGNLHRSLAPALYCFGASVTESGNNNYLLTHAKANYTPYGIDFTGGVPTGRFTNGKTIVDFLAERLGLPHAPPYLGLEGKDKPLTGVNYASGSCGVLDETGQRLGMCLPLRKQVNYFQSTVKEFKKRLPKRHLKKYLSESIFTINVGTNDYINNYLQPSLYNSSLLYTPQQFAQLLVNRLSTHLKRLYNSGARKIVVFDIPPTGCLPAVSNSMNSSTSCVETVNNLVVLYNEMLEKRLSNLGYQLKGSKFFLGATYNTTLDMNLNPKKYGFEEQRKPCCDISMGLCLPSGQPCEDRNKFIYFDGVHWSERVHSYLTAACFDQSPSICVPSL